MPRKAIIICKFTKYKVKIVEIIVTYNMYSIYKHLNNLAKISINNMGGYILAVYT